MTIDVLGKKVVLTGALTTMTRSQATEKLEDLGAIVTGSVTSKTEILFIGDRPGSKLEKAESYGIPIYKENELVELLGQERPDAPVVRKAEVLQEIEEGEAVEVEGSAADPYVLKNIGGVYSCTCPAWRNQSLAIDKRTCKHLQSVRGEEAEAERVGGEVSIRKKAKGSDKPKLLLAKKWEDHVNPQGWWMSEKLDGVRAYWDGTTFFSRLGNEFLAPEWFTKGLPDSPLDGELWIDRGAFQKTVSIVRRQDRGKAWENVKYIIFDAPDHGGSFEERYEHFYETFPEGRHPYARALLHELCIGLDHLNEELERVENLGGEGLMLRKAASKYIGSRSSTLLKVKTFHDAEAKVEGYSGGQGKHRNRVGALKLITPQGTRFSCGSGLSDAERENPPAIGAIVTYRFQELTDAGVPRFPTYVGERADAEWPGDGVEVKSTTKSKTRIPKTEKQEENSMAKNTLNLSKGSDSFQISQSGKTLTIVLGTQTEAEEEMDRLVGQKIKKGFVLAEKTSDNEEDSEKERFEFISGSSSKFWEIAVSGDSHTVCYGKIGTNGTCKTKSFTDHEAALKDATRLKKQKQKKGYEAL